jgi:hypothetical protein
MQVIEAQCASILEPHDHLHINHERVMKAEPGKPSRAASFRSPLELGTGSTGARPRSLTSMPCAAAQIQLACRTVGHLGGVPFRLLGDRERPVFRAEGAIGR